MRTSEIPHEVVEILSDLLGRSVCVTTWTQNHIGEHMEIGPMSEWAFVEGERARRIEASTGAQLIEKVIARECAERGHHYEIQTTQHAGGPGRHHLEEQCVRCGHCNDRIELCGNGCDDRDIAAEHEATDCG